MDLQYLVWICVLTVSVKLSFTQICKNDSIILPNEHICDQKLHILHHDYPAIRRYCGQISKNVVANTGKLTKGKDAEKGEVPYLGSLVFGGKHRCGVVLIDNIHVVTAAHCIVMRAALDQRLVPEELTVILGTNVRYKPSFFNPDAIIKEVVGWEVHPAYQREAFNKFGPFAGNDLAILRLSEPVEFSSTIWPICVGTPSDELGHVNISPIIIAGFGSDGVRYNNLMQISEKLELLTQDQCYKELMEKSQRQLKDSQLCTLPSESSFGKNQKL